MTAKETALYVASIATFVMMGSLLRRRLPEEFAYPIAALTMLLVGFPLTRSLSGKQLNFKKWAVLSTLGGLAGVAVVFIMKRLEL